MTIRDFLDLMMDCEYVTVYDINSSSNIFSKMLIMDTEHFIDETEEIYVGLVDMNVESWNLETTNCICLNVCLD